MSFARRLLGCTKCYLCCVLVLALVGAGGGRKKPYSYQYVHREFYEPPDYDYDDEGTG